MSIDCIVLFIIIIVHHFIILLVCFLLSIIYGDCIQVVCEVYNWYDRCIHA